MKKSKKTLILLSVLCLIGVLAIGGIILMTGNTSEPVTAVAENVDIDWYDENGKEFLLTTVEELYGLAELSKTHDFKGQTIKLGADIVINEGDASQWAEQAPEQLWTPVTGFAGTFDGQGHTVSGVYGNSIVTSLGLFTDTQKGCVIRNLNLVNSCFKNNNDMGTGSIIGIGGGTLENIYSDAVLVSAGKNIGGLIGCVKAKGENQIINCWFDGTIIMDGYNCSGVGGLVGAYTVEDAINTIAHSLSTADISCMGENVGGICGYVGNGAFLNLSDSMFTGTLEYDTNKYAVVGSVVGQTMNSASIIVNDTYTMDEIANRTIGTSSGYQKGNAIAIGRNYLLGVGGYQWTTLDFENYWVAQKDGMPRLSYFTQAIESLEGVEKMVDVSWYDPAAAAFEITNVQQLYGFAYLSRSYDFRGQTIKLGADITVNEGDASTWGEKAPAYNWTPIAWYGSSLSQRFKGTFDGQGHTVSGIYCKGTENITSLGFFGEVYHGAVVKNFKLENSYFEGVQDASIRGPVGSIAGRLRGTIEDVYSDAIVVNSSKNTGGIVGMITGTGQNKISGCWFNGTLTGISRSGGILGGVYGNKGNIEATIEHCLNTGTIRVEAGQAAVGGICGSVETWSILYIDDCLNTGFYGTVGTDKKTSTHIGTLLGTVTQNDGVGSKAVITDSYGVKDFYSRLVGWKHGDEGVEQNSMMYVDRQELIGYGGYKWTSLDFDGHWSIRGNACPVPVAFAPRKLSTAGLVRMVDYSWYNPNKTVHTIWNFQQLYGMARLWEVTNQFKNQTVKLGADIVLNKGDASQWGEKAPEYVWVPARFNGTFDGQGHTISGIYVKGGEEDNYVGLFHRIYQNGTVKNLKLTNSYIEGTMAGSERGAVGSIAGRSNGIIDTVYSDAIVVNSARMTGGLVGMITGEGANTIRNSWFDGQITAINRTGGILGGMYGNKQDIEVVIENCANTGHIAVPRSYGDVGGICGIAETGGTLYITDCLNTGTYEAIDNGKSANTHIGTVFGSVTNNGVASHVVLTDAYGVNSFYNRLVGWKYADEGVTSGNSKIVKEEKIKGYDAYYAMALDYEVKPYWVLKEDAVPVLAAFNSGATLSVEEAKEQADTSWYDENATEYIITTAQQLLGFNSLCNDETDYFAGKTVKLGADITLNEGNAADWASKVPENVWKSTGFKGTLDGQGYTVSGLYTTTSSGATYTGFFNNIYSGATVKNLKLVNSYIEGTKTSGRAGTGSIAGRVYGTIENVYSSAIVKNGAVMTGGIAGMSEGGKISNCWFDGTVYGGRATGGILGGTYAKAVTIEYCLNTGTLNVAASSQYAGGLCGELQNAATAVIKDSLNAGELAGTVRDSGTIVGRVDAKAALTVTDTYGVSEFLTYAIGAQSGTVTGSNYAVRKLADIKGYGAYQWMTLDFDGGNWVLKKDAIPALGVFDTTDLILDFAKTLPDYSWYDEKRSTFDITTAGQLLGFNELGATNDFAGKTFKLGASITLSGDSQNWTPAAFSGIFDGQGYTISGIRAQGENAGLFSTLSSGAAVKDLKITDSRITGTTAAGGIAGVADGATVSNCWFAGDVSGATAGGILGEAKNGATVEHCLNTGSVAGSANAGGLIGSAESASVSDSLNVGVKTGSAANAGAIVGKGADALTITHAYGIKEFAESAVGNGKQSALSANYGAVSEAKIKGYDAYFATTLDFEVKPYWVLKDGAIPGLAAFDTATLTVADAKSQPDTSWYDEDVDAYVINNVAQMRGYAKLCDEGVDFTGKTVTLGADTFELSSAEQLGAFAAVCAVNDFAGVTVKLGADVALTEWTPVDFGGTFDGNGKAISGLSVSLFNKLDGATVKNLKLTNSVATEATNSTISNCVLTNAEASILGIAKDGTTLEHCYSDGGLIADVQGATVVKDSLAAGTPVAVAANGKLTMTNVFGIGDANGSVAVGGAAYTVRNLEDLQGYGAYQWTTLDFDNGTWVLKADAIPVLKKFNGDASTDLSLEEAKKLPDYNWYDETAGEYVISDARQMHGYMLLKDTVEEKSVTLGASEYVLTTADHLLAFNSLSAETDYFAGKTVKLGASIALNGESKNWTPVSIKCLFDGQGYTISGVNVSAGSTYVGFFHTVYSEGTVKNLKLVNSTIKNTKTSGNCGTGSIAGRCLGTIDTVYSNATVTNGAAMTGGIVGMVVAVDGVKDGAKKITNCWFDGIINGNAATGGILGGSYGMPATIEHCLNTGTLNIAAGKKQLGGLVGYVQGAASVMISDSLNAGELNATSNTQTGTIVGAIAKANTLTVSNVYGVTEFSNNLSGYKPEYVTSGSVWEKATLETYYGTGAAKLDYTNYWTAREGMIPILKSFS